MKRRIRNKIIRRFCNEHHFKLEYFQDVTGHSAKELVSNLWKWADEMMEYHYRRYGY